MNNIIFRYPSPLTRNAACAQVRVPTDKIDKSRNGVWETRSLVCSLVLIQMLCHTLQGFRCIFHWFDPIDFKCNWIDLHNFLYLYPSIYISTLLSDHWSTHLEMHILCLHGCSTNTTTADDGWLVGLMANKMVREEDPSAVNTQRKNE